MIDKMIPGVDDRDEAAICHMDAAVSVSVVSANGKLVNFATAVAFFWSAIARNLILYHA